MRYENVIQVYWSRGIFFSRELVNFSTPLRFFWGIIPGLKQTLKTYLIARFELVVGEVAQPLTSLFSKKRTPKAMNVLFSQKIPVNYKIHELLPLVLLRFFLTKSYKGFRYIAKKPIRGQKTRSNASSANKLNTLIMDFLVKEKLISKKQKILKKDWKKLEKKRRKPVSKIKQFKVLKTVWY